VILSSRARFLASLEHGRVPSPRPIASKEVPLVDSARSEDQEDEQSELSGGRFASEESKLVEERGNSKKQTD